MSKIGSLLVQDQVISVSEFEQVLQHQVIHGGSLATNILEMGVLAAAVVAEYEARLFDLPLLEPDLVLAAEIRALKVVPWETIQRHGFIPLRVSKNKLVVAISAPLSEEAAQELAALLDVEVEPHFVLEHLLSAGLNEYYGLPISDRNLKLLKRLQPEFEPNQPPIIPAPRGARSAAPDTGRPPPTAEPMVSVGQTPIVPVGAPPAGGGFVVESGSAREPSEDATMRIFTPGGSPPAPIAPNPTPKLVKPASKPPAEVPAPAEEGFDLRRAKQRLADADNRDALLDLLIECAGEVFDFAMLFVVQGVVAQGRSAIEAHGRPRDVDDVAISLEQGGAFQTVFETKAFHLGPLGTSEVEERSLTQMGRRWPHNCAILPVLLRHRVVLIIYGDSGPAGVQADQVTEFVRFTHRVGDAFEDLLLKRKKPAEEPAQAVQAEAQAPSSRATEDDGEPTDLYQPRGLVDWAGKYHVTDPETPSRLDRPTEPPSAPVPSTPPKRVANPPIEAEVSPSHTRWVDDQTLKTEPIPLYQEGEPRRHTQDLGRWPNAHGPGRPVPEIAGAEAIRSEVSGEAVFSRSVVSITDGTTAPQGAPDSASPDSEPPLPPEEKTPTQEPAAENPSVTTRNVISITPPPPARSVVVKMNEEVDRLVERILIPGHFDETAANLLVGIGDDALLELVQHFPGPLIYDRYQETGRLPPIEQHGPLLKTMLLFGEKAVPYLLPLFESTDSDIRFYATFIFSEIHAPAALGGLTSRLFDNDRQIRSLATEVIARFEAFPEYRWAMREIVDVLRGPNSGVDAKRIAAVALGEFGERTGVVAAAEMLGSVDSTLVERCHRALTRITFTDFGFSTQRWIQWWDQNKDRHRIEWIIDAIPHPKEAIRNSALRELKAITEEIVEWPVGPMDHKQRLMMRKTLTKWWQNEGRELYPIPEETER